MGVTNAWFWCCGPCSTGVLQHFDEFLIRSSSVQVTETEMLKVALKIREITLCSILFVTSKPILQLKVLQNVFNIKKRGLKSK